MKIALTFDDVLLVPQFSSILPKEVQLKSNLTRNIKLNIPIISAAMDTVTESRMAIAMAREGGIGVIHKNLSIEDQVKEVDRVKRSESGMILDPITLSVDATVGDALNIMKEYKKELLGFTAGNFDLLHPGYIKCFREAKRHCDKFIIFLQKKPRRHSV